MQILEICWKINTTDHIKILLSDVCGKKYEIINAEPYVINLAKLCTKLLIIMLAHQFLERILSTERN